MTESTELIALREKLAQIEVEVEINRRLIEVTSARNGVLASDRSDCLKQIAKLLANQQAEQ